MSFGGSVLAMINTLKNNKLLLGERNSYFRAKKSYLRATKGMKLTYQKTTKEELKFVREKIKQQKRVERFKALIVLTVIIPTVIFGSYKLFETLGKEHAEQKYIVKNKVIKEYQFYISDGDLMIEKKKWNNAIFQYTRALEVFPNEFDAQYRLALAYTYKCQNKNEGCFIADSLVNKLNAFYPKDVKIKELKELIKNQLHN